MVYDTVIGFNFTITPSQNAASIPAFLADTGIPVVDQGKNLIISLDTNQTLPVGTSASVEITLVPEILNQLTGYTQLTNSLFSTKIQLSSFGNNTHYQGSLETNTFMSVGFYITELIISNTSANFTGDFFNNYYLSAPDPKIDTAKSTVGGKTLETYDINNTNLQTLSIQPSQKIDFSIQAQSLSGGGSAFVLFVPFYPFLESQDVLAYWQLNQTSASLFTGSIILPSVTSVDIGNGRVLNFGNNLITALLVILRDKQGNIDLFSVITTMNNNSFSPDNVMMLLFFVVIPALIVTGYYLKSRNKRKNDSYNYNFRSYQYNTQTQNPYQGYPPPYQPNQSFQQQDEVKFCPYCGSSLTPGSNFCMECGKKIK